MNSQDPAHRKTSLSGKASHHYLAVYVDLALMSQFCAGMQKCLKKNIKGTTIVTSMISGH